jgi:phenylalanine-4-hydroxylase
MNGKSAVDSNATVASALNPAPAATEHKHSHQHPAVENGVFITQHWTQYTPEQHSVWQTLYERRMADLESSGSQVYLQGAKVIGLKASQIPKLDNLNQRLSACTQWKAVAVSGFLPAQQFFECLAKRNFPTTVTIRDGKRLDYVPEPDIFHDVFGHVPLHAEPVFAAFLQRFGRIASLVSNEADREKMTRLFWFTVEFGLIAERGETKVYGSGLISSHKDCANALSENCKRRAFTLEEVFAQDFEIDDLQPTLFVLDSFQQLYEAVEQARVELRV